jgi:predicted nucleotide-binding protein
VQQSLERSKQRNLALLSQAIEVLEERLSEQAVAAVTASPRAERETFSRKIFVVHGRDEGPREATARFLEKLGFEAIILHEHASQGRTVIEKIEAHSDVGFAVILVTPDDEGCLKGETPVSRARQNVLLELGYFVGKLGRKNVCVLQRGAVEIPSDWRGVIDHPFDAGGGWKRTLAKELEAAGFEIDWKKAN